MSSQLPGHASANALVTGQIVMADMTFYIVEESKLDALSEQNDSVKLYYSLAATFASLGVGLLSSAVFADKLTDYGKSALWLGLPSFAILAIAFAWRGWWFRNASGGTLREIKTNPKSAKLEFTLRQAELSSSASSSP